MTSPDSIPPSPADRAGEASKKHDAKDRALNALHAMAKPQPKALIEPLPPPMETGGSASGFVGMLAKGQFAGSGVLSAERPVVSEEGKPRHKYPLEMAREISAAQPLPAPADAMRVPRPRPMRPPNRMLPVMLALACVLLLIGAWAAGALIYMGTVHPAAPEDVHYPLIQWSLDVVDASGMEGGYTGGSRIMAWSMLACLPLAAGLILLALLSRSGRTKKKPD